MAAMAEALEAKRRCRPVTARNAAYSADMSTGRAVWRESGLAAVSVRLRPGVYHVLDKQGTVG